MEDISIKITTDKGEKELDFNIDDNLKLFSVVDKYNELLKYTIYLESRLTTLESNLNINIPENTKTNPPKKID